MATPFVPVVTPRLYTYPYATLLPAASPYPYASPYALPYGFPYF